MVDQLEDMCTPNVMPELIAFLSSLLQRMAESNGLPALGAPPQKISIFTGLTRPTISIKSYLERIFKYANCSPSCYIVAYVYLDRLTHHQPALSINPLNVHRLLITSVMLSAKFMDDMYYNNAYYAKLGGISTAEMNFLEVDFLFGLGFHLNVSPPTFHTYCSYLQTEMILMQPKPQPRLINDIINNGISSSSSSSKILLHLCFNHEDESSSHGHQQEQEQLAV